MPYGVGSVANGGILMSDGTITYPSPVATTSLGAGMFSIGNPAMGGRVVDTNPRISGGSSQPTTQPTQQKTVSQADADWAKYHPNEGTRPPGYGGEGGQGGQGGQNIDTSINEAYGPTLSALGEATRRVNENAISQETGFEETAANRAKQFGTEQENLLADTATGQNAFNQTLQSALSEASRSYNALRQQGRARYGLGNSAGQAVGELAAQEYLRQQGQLGQKGVAGSQAFETQKVKIKQYVTQKLDDLKLWKDDAIRQVKQNLNDKLTEIDLRRGDIEANKTKDKLAALQAVRERVFAIQSADTTFKQNLALQAVGKMQEISGRVFTPAEINAYIPGLLGNLPATAGTPTTQTIKPGTGRYYTQDELLQLGYQ